MEVLPKDMITRWILPYLPTRAGGRRPAADPAEVVGAAPGLTLKKFYQFNGKENQLDLDLNWNHQDWRFYDYQLGRWHVVDPLIESDQESWTPYQFGFDNAVRYADADGRCPGGCPPTPGVQPDLINRMVLGIGISIVNLNGQMWAGILGTKTKYAADYVTDASGIAVDYQIHKVPVGTDAQELKSFALDELNLLTLAVGGGEGKAFEQAAGKAASAEAVQGARFIVAKDGTTTFKSVQEGRAALEKGWWSKAR